MYHILYIQEDPRINNGIPLPFILSSYCDECNENDVQYVATLLNRFPGHHFDDIHRHGCSSYRAIHTASSPHMGMYAATNNNALMEDTKYLLNLQTKFNNSQEDN